MDRSKRYAVADLLAFSKALLEALDVPADEAASTADALSYADLSGIDSHGVALLSVYDPQLRSGAWRARRTISVVHETPSTALMDADGGLGHPAGVRAMAVAIEKATLVGSACVGVRESNHYGAAGYYAQLALPHDMIGFSVTNAGPAMLPTFGLQPQLGTNPLAVAVPTTKAPPFVLDMATTVKAIGKLRLVGRMRLPAPVGWLLGADGRPEHDPLQFTRSRRSGMLGGLLPLGGAGEELSGHKGFGLGLTVELLALLGGGTPAPFMMFGPGCPPTTVGHFFGAVRVDAFRPAAEFKADVDRVLARIMASPKMPGHERILTAGVKEFECRQERQRLGIPLDSGRVEELRSLAAPLNVPMPEPLA